MNIHLAAALAGAGTLGALMLLGSAPASGPGTAADLQLRLLARTALPTLALIGAAALLRTVLGTGLGLLRAAPGLAGFAGSLLTLPSALPEVVLGFVVFWAMFAPLSPWAWLVALTVPGVLHVAVDVHARADALLVKPWIESAVAVGSGRSRLLLRHLLPHLRPVMPALFATQAAGSVVLLGEVVLVTAYIGLGSSLAGLQIVTALQSSYFPTWGMALPPALAAITRGDLQTVLIPALAFASLLALCNGAAELVRRLEFVDLPRGLTLHRS